jgi:hypothetical protein
VGSSSWREVLRPGYDTDVAREALTVDEAVA